MIMIIAFIICVIVWDRFKKSVRGAPKIKVSLPKDLTSECGCIVNQNRTKVKTVCKAHQMMWQISEGR